MRVSGRERDLSLSDKGREKAIMSEALKKTKVGQVTGRKTDKTAVVSVSRLMQDVTFKKYLKKVRTYKVHDEKNECRLGDQVEIVETRPLSKEKRWKLNKVLVRNEIVEV